MRKSLTRSERIKKRSDINRLFSEGKSVSCFGAKLLYRKNDLHIHRIICIPAKKFGRAVDRNAVKRHVREIFRLHKERLNNDDGYDIAIVVYPGKTYDYWKRNKQILTLFEKSGLLL